MFDVCVWAILFIFNLFFPKISCNIINSYIFLLVNLLFSTEVWMRGGSEAARVPSGY